MEKLKIDLPIIVEGKYDKIRVASVADACIIQTDGFGVFKNAERLALIRRLAEQSRIIVLTDPDGAGKLIRSHVTSAIPRERLIQLYVPQVEGKERRKSQASKEGFLGVEGIDNGTLYRLLEPFATQNADETPREEKTKLDLFELGLTGGADSAKRRDELAVSLGMPRGMTSNALLAAASVLMDRAELYKKARELGFLQE